jgi:hypothetical protein
MSLALDMEEPLNDATDFVRALWLMGDGMAAHNQEGEPIAAVARVALQRLAVLKDAWNAVIEAARR